MHIALSEGLGFRVCVCVRERERESESQRKLNFFLLHSREAFQYSHWPTLFLYISHIYRERERSSASGVPLGVPLESPVNFILINIFEIFL